MNLFIHSIYLCFPITELTVVPKWPSILPEDKLTLGQVGGVATDSKGNVYIFHRGSRTWGGR